MNAELLHTVRFVFQQLARREKNHWLGATRPGKPAGAGPGALAQLEEWEIPLDEKTRGRLHQVADLAGLLERFMLKGVRGDSHMGLWGLVSGRYPLTLLHYVPTPAQMLERQCRGERYVTHLDNPGDLDRPIGRFGGSYEFLMHDLEHAHKFFGEPDLFSGQVAFFNLLKRSLPKFEKWLIDPSFEKDFNYLKSDMNSHPVHLFKYIKAIVLTAELRSGQEDQVSLDRFWNEILEEWQTPADIRKAALRINRPGLETSEDQAAVHQFFKNYRPSFETGAQLC